MRMADAVSLSEKEINLRVYFVCEINEPKPAALIKPLVQKSWQVVLLEYKFILWKLCLDGIPVSNTPGFIKYL